jgi:8-amino-7-oxononanoate synthase
VVNGHSHAHHALEEELADFVGRERALLFSTGYMANLGVFSALLAKGDYAFEDRLNHASLLDAALLSGARLQRYQHQDTKNLESKIRSVSEGEILVASDGVFSMDGDLASLPELASVASAHDAWLMVDDAHGIGVLGKQGRGSLDYFDLDQEQVPILMGTLGKAIGTFGAFVAGSEALIETLIQKARTYIYTTATPPAVAEATRVSLRLVQQEEWRREKLVTLIRQFRQGAQELGLQLMESSSPIQPMVVGDSARAIELSEKLLQKGILITAIRPPTVPEGTSRLRITFSADHDEAHVNTLLNTLEQVMT